MTRWRSIAPTPRSRAPSSPAGVWDTGLRRPKAPFAYVRTRPRSRWLRRSTGRRSVPRSAAAMSCSVLQQLFQLVLGAYELAKDMLRRALAHHRDTRSYMAAFIPQWNGIGLRIGTSA